MNVANEDPLGQMHRELVEIKLALRQLETSLEHDTKDRSRTQEDQQRRIRELNLRLYGDSGSPGLLREVDRLLESEANRKWQVRALWTALIGLTIHSIARALGWLGTGS